MSDNKENAKKEEDRPIGVSCDFCEKGEVVKFSRLERGKREIEQSKNAWIGPYSSGYFCGKECKDALARLHSECNFSRMNLELENHVKRIAELEKRKTLFSIVCERMSEYDGTVYREIEDAFIEEYRFNDLDHEALIRLIKDDFQEEENKIELAVKLVCVGRNQFYSLLDSFGFTEVGVRKIILGYLVKNEGSIIIERVVD